MTQHGAKEQEQNSSDDDMSLPDGIDDILRSYIARRDDALSIVVGLGANRLVEQARRHLEGLTFKATYNSSRVNALTAVVANLRNELEPLLLATQKKAIELAFAQAELEAYAEAERRVHVARQDRKIIGMYAEAAHFAQALFDEHQIDRSHYAALAPEDLRDIADVIRSRTSMRKSPEACLAAIESARAFGRSEAAS